MTTTEDPSAGCGGAGDPKPGEADPADPEAYDADALVGRLKRNATISLIGVALLVGAVWREPMAVLGALLGGGLVLLNFALLESVASAMLGSGNPAPNPLQIAFLAFRVVLMGLILYGIFALPGVRLIPVALGLSILVLAVIGELFSEVLPAPPSGA